MIVISVISRDGLLLKVGSYAQEGKSNLDREIIIIEIIYHTLNKMTFILNTYPGCEGKLVSKSLIFLSNSDIFN